MIRLQSSRFCIGNVLNKILTIDEFLMLGDRSKYDYIIRTLLVGSITDSVSGVAWRGAARQPPLLSRRPLPGSSKRNVDRGSRTRNLLLDVSFMILNC